jgi:hypothetical protein
MMRKFVLCKLVAFLGLAVVIALPAVCGAQQAAAKMAAPVKAPAAKLGNTPCRRPASCAPGKPCNYPFVLEDCWTTKYGPAKADVIIGAPKAGAVRSTNMLYCEGNTYALCFFSGPPDKGLPCEVNGDGAKCTCQAYTSGPNFVDINGILNNGAYSDTVAICGHEGENCRNIVNCGPRGDLPGCKDHKEPPVCRTVKHQNPNEPKVSLMPKADLISTFSFAMSPVNGSGPYMLGSTPCTGLYAGCMTAPCTYGPNHTSPTKDGEPVTCECPTYSGTYQIGQKGQTCAIPGSNPSYVWSASNTVKPKSGGK